jgi:hypothetical protein
MSIADDVAQVGLDTPAVSEYFEVGWLNVLWQFLPLGSRGGARVVARLMQ